MSHQKITPRTLPGFMELLPEEQRVMNRIMDTIRHNYELFGFTPLDTPVIELAEVLLAKAGGETEKQIYQFQKGDSDLVLRFDLTVPLARYVAEHQNDLTFPFKRYQIGKVYRGERPQKARFREFYQCDIDVIGNEKLGVMYDAEMPSVIYNIFTQLGLKKFKIRLNNRKILKGFFTSLNLQDQITDILRIVDKIAKIGTDAVRKELLEMNIPEASVQKIMAFIGINGSNTQILEQLRKLPVSDESFTIGVDELDQVVKGMTALSVPETNTQIDLTIARGLDYYTGTVYETIFDDYPEIGSVCSGGRYDDLASHYTDKKLPGVGISIGLTRLFDQMRDKGFIVPDAKTPARLLILPMDAADQEQALKLATLARAAGISTEVYMEEAKFKNKMTYANKLGVPFVGIIGEEERLSDMIVIKNMQTGDQVKQPLKVAVSFVSDALAGMTEPFIQMP